jgi:hypothetical protein
MRARLKLRSSCSSFGPQSRRPLLATSAQTSANTVCIGMEIRPTPSDPFRGPQGPCPHLPGDSKNEPEVPISGGGRWTSYTIDPATGRLYVPVGNPAPDYVKSLREGPSVPSGFQDDTPATVRYAASS